jgi:hypothetical protein
MTRRKRLLETLKGNSVDRPAVSFYEIDGSQNTEDTDPFNIYNHPSWKPLIELAREKTDRIVRQWVGFKNTPPNPLQELTKTESIYGTDGALYTTTTIKAGKRTLTTKTKRDKDIDTVWTLEHLLKDEEDAEAWLALPSIQPCGEPDIETFLKMEKELGEDGIAMVDISDPLCGIAPLFHMEAYTIIAMTDEKLFRQMLDKDAKIRYWKIEQIAKALPGRLWRICGPEYASEPYLPPHLFHQYVTEYDKKIVEIINRSGGYARIHSHGRLHNILDYIVETGCMGLDPIEPPPQGDVELIYVRQKYGKKLVLFGNLEIADIENLPEHAFRAKVKNALIEGTSGTGRGFVLMPSASPYGRVLSEKTLQNYFAMIDEVEKFS